jgi:hypothetical protein
MLEYTKDVEKSSAPATIPTESTAISSLSEAIRRPLSVSSIIGESLTAPPYHGNPQG